MQWRVHRIQLKFAGENELQRWRIMDAYYVGTTRLVVLSILTHLPPVGGGVHHHFSTYWDEISILGDLETVNSEPYKRSAQRLGTKTRRSPLFIYCLIQCGSLAYTPPCGCGNRLHLQRPEFLTMCRPCRSGDAFIH
jgi:hypothetical protein